MCVLHRPKKTVRYVEYSNHKAHRHGKEINIPVTRTIIPLYNALAAEPMFQAGKQ